MAVLKKNELKGMDATALAKKLGEIDVEIALNMGAIKTTGKPSNHQFRELRRLRSTIKALLAQKRPTA